VTAPAATHLLSLLARKEGRKGKRKRRKNKRNEKGNEDRKRESCGTVFL
jgi:hypothetical protein